MATTGADPGAPRTVRIRVGGRAFDATLRDNAAARSLLDLLPLTVPLTDYGGQEKTAPLPGRLAMTGMPPGDDATALDLGYYAPGPVLVLYYADVAHHSGLARLGRIHATARDLEALPDGALATVELADSSG